MDELTLNCWVRSEDPEAFFQVKVSSTDTVYSLQKAIKNEKTVAFRDVDPYNLALYKPKAPISIPFQVERLRKFILSENGEMLYGMYRLSNVFPEPPPEYDIHVIVDAPSKIVCFLRGALLSDSFRLAICRGEDVGHLIPRMKDAQPDLRSVANHRIRLYRISGDENELRECLGNTGDGELLSGQRLAPNFLGVPVLDPLRVVIEVSTSPTRECERLSIRRHRVSIISQPQSHQLRLTHPTSPLTLRLLVNVLLLPPASATSMALIPMKRGVKDIKRILQLWMMALFA
ncbi:hypothetical protein BGW80DRAFT_836767 [Lactifluus volemus]|nr:hypothetical protein BGW80DRAFT_836767 [Lactifluus volemus]